MIENVIVTAGPLRRFLEALERLEMHRELAAIVRCFARDAELSRLGREAERGRDGAHRFWAEYRQSFGDLRSRFLRISEEGPVKVLEWRSEGTLPQGAPIVYAGVSLVEFDGASERIVRFRTYFDSAAVVAGAAASDVPPEAGTRPYSEAV
jgi:limonene-1,2-epoxide hydrolase